MVGIHDGVVVRIDGVQPANMAVYGVESAVGRTAYILAQVNPDAPGRQVKAVPVDQHGVAVAGVATEYEWVEVTFWVERQEPVEDGDDDPPDGSDQHLER